MVGTTRLLACCCLSLLPCFCAPGRCSPADAPPPLLREFRAAWIATVANIDWPSRPGLSVAQMQAEMDTLLDTAERLRLNAVVFQVRPACDAIYASGIEPWSAYLTGVPGQPPAERFDPLRYVVGEAHARGIQVHAWFNPYRASHPTDKHPPASNHVSHIAPDAVVRYGKYLWLDPGCASAEEHTLSVIRDVVRRYDVDGVHFDDYFYPYPIKKKDEEGEDTDQVLPFPDDSSWQEYLNQTPDGQRMQRDDWRRENVNRLIRRVGDTVHNEKPWVLFGVSPFGIWRPGHPKGIVGFDAYASLYADSKLWLQEGWVDYIAPQLYWQVESKGQSYPKLLAWWEEQNSHSRGLWPGLYASKIQHDDKQGWESSELIRQVKITQQSSTARGNIHFSAKALSKDYSGIRAALATGPYAASAIIPQSPWIKHAEPPAKPVAKWEDDSVLFDSRAQPAVWQWAIQAKRGRGWETHLVPGDQQAFRIPNGTEVQVVAVRAVDRLGRTSPVLVLRNRGG